MKKKKGIKDEVQLTSKQKEMMQAQLEKESSVRKRLQGVWKQSSWHAISKTECCSGTFFIFSSSHSPQLDVELQSVLGLLEATLIERPPQITWELPSVLQVLMPLLNSPLAAPRIHQVFLDIGVCLMPQQLQHLGTPPLFALCSSDGHSFGPAAKSNFLKISLQLCLWDTWLWGCWSQSATWTRPGDRKTWTQQPTALCYCCTTTLSLRERARQVSQSSHSQST